MNQIFRIAVGSAAVVFVGAIVSGCAKEASAQAQSKSPLGREEIALTVFADDFAQVGERRPFELSAGTNRLRIGEVSRSLDPSSTLFDWSDSTQQVVSNTYDLGIGDQQNLMRRYLGEEVELVTFGDNGKPGDRRTGTLELANEEGLVVRSDGKLIVNPPATLVAPDKADLVTRPQLSLGVEASKAGKADLDVTYLTRGLSWSADYVLTLDPNSDLLKLECWATVQNRTGVDFPAAKVTLMAGSPNRAATLPASLAEEGVAGNDRFAARKAPMTPMPYASEVGVPQATGELYAYPISSKVDIAQDQLNRVLMLKSEQVKVNRDYSVRLDRYYGYGQNRQSPLNATLAINFPNVNKSGLGLPLPTGTVRAYEPVKGQGARYIGAAGIRDTPNEGRVDLTLTNVFDVTALPKLVSTKQLDKKRSRQVYEVTLSNRKAAPVELRVVKSFYGKWQIDVESEKSVRLDSSTAQWKAALPANSEKALRFEVVVG